MIKTLTIIATLLTGGLLSQGSVEFGGQESDCNTITFWTESESNSHSFLVQHSYNGIEWNNFYIFGASSFSNTTTYYHMTNDRGGGFFKITSSDFFGDIQEFGIFDIDCTLSLNTLHNNKVIEGYYNTMGHKVSPETKGLKIVRYTDGTIKKIY